MVNYDSSVIKPLGFIEINLTFKQVIKSIKLFIVNQGGPPLLGRDFLILIFNTLDNLRRSEANVFQKSTIAFCAG